MKMTTLCYIEKDNNYLMLHRTKKENDINKGKWIGVGGHAEGCETPEECLLREVKEETGLTLTSYCFRGLITFISDECEPELMCLFTANDYDGEVIICDEGDLCCVVYNTSAALLKDERSAHTTKYCNSFTSSILITAVFFNYLVHINISSKKIYPELLITGKFQVSILLKSV
jgi:8-oxo-dGTP pyrophosphatase MutT (NUDIX family)